MKGWNWTLTFVYIAEHGYTEDLECSTIEELHDDSELYDENYNYHDADYSSVYETRTPIEFWARDEKEAKRKAMEATKLYSQNHPGSELGHRIELALRFYAPHWRRLGFGRLERYYQSDRKLRRAGVGLYIKLNPNPLLKNDTF